jgi:HEPN domain-containing protein
MAIPIGHGAWIAQAEHDLDVARTLLAQGHFAWAAYAAQQSGEKAAKAARIVLGTPAAAMKSHDIAQLIGEIGARHPRYDATLMRVAELETHNQGARYPGVRNADAPFRSFPPQTAVDAIDIAQALLDFCRQLCGKAEQFWLTV